MHKKILLNPYDSNWPKLFEEEATRIRDILGDQCVQLHHIGSTSIPGLSAKPRIDIVAAVKRPEETAVFLEGIGYQYKGEYNIPLHWGFSKREGGQVNLHVYEEEHPEIELSLAFRNYLRVHPETRDAYGALKYEILQEEQMHQVGSCGL
jgi:GrpB-like predicted nucleotidyltransferase (UPF0157 family)